MKERYGYDCTTHSTAALEAYVEAGDILLSAQSGVISKLQLAVAEDRDFALAHVTLAQAYQMMSLPTEAAASLKTGLTLAKNTSEWEQAHIRVVASMFNDDNKQAYQTAISHLDRFPRDALIADAVCGAFGLIGFSGRQDREQENLAFMEGLARHYGDDWWFNSQFAFAVSEAGDPARALPIAEHALEANTDNADAVHNLAHLRYETDDSSAGLEELEQWRKTYHRGGILYGHIAWHCALWNLEFGNHDRAMEILKTEIHPDNSLSPPINLVTDFIAFLLRAELSGCEISQSLWHTASQTITRYFPEPGISFVDAHAAVAFAKCKQSTLLSPYLTTKTGTAADQVHAVARAADAYSSGDWSGVVDSLSPIISSSERLGGSRAQRDMLEALLVHSLLKLGMEKEAISGISARRSQVNKKSFGLSVNAPYASNVSVVRTGPACR